MEPLTWHRVKLSDSQVKDLMGRAFSMRMGGANDGLAVYWSEPESKRGELAIYFSPDASELAVSLGATPCDEPSPDGLRMLIGDPSVWGTFNPLK